MDQFPGSVWNDCLWSEEDSVCWEIAVRVVKMGEYMKMQSKEHVVEVSVESDAKK